MSEACSTHGEITNASQTSGCKNPTSKQAIRRTRKDIIKSDVKETTREAVHWIHFAQDKEQGEVL